MSLLLHSSSPSHLGCCIQGWFDKPKPTWSSGTAIAVHATFRWLWEIQAPTVLADFIATSWKSLGLWHFLGWSLGANGVQRIFQGEADVSLTGEMKTGFVLVRELFGCAKSFDTLAVYQGAHPSLISCWIFTSRLQKSKERLCCDQEVKENGRRLLRVWIS